MDFKKIIEQLGENHREIGEALKDPSKIEPMQFGVEDILFWREHSGKSSKSSKNQKKDDKKGDK